MHVGRAATMLPHPGGTHVLGRTRVAIEPSAFPDVGDVVRNAVARLEPLERRALTMIYGRGLSQQQVAEQLGQPRSAVGEAVARALQAIAGSLVATQTETHQGGRILPLVARRTAS